MYEQFPNEVKKAIQKAVKSYPGMWKSKICAYYQLDRKTGVHTGRDSQAGDVCHAGFLGSDHLIVVNAHKPEWQEKHKDFIQWVIYESPFTHGVLNKENEDEIFGQAAVLDMDEIGNGGVLWLCKAIRLFEENSYVIKAWDRLRKHGLDGLQAFIGASILDSGGNPYRSITHTTLFHYDTPAKLRKVYDTIKVQKKRQGDAATGWGAHDAKDWGSLKGGVEKKPDGWGGFVEVEQPGGAKKYAEKLKEIFEGDPKNVK